MADGDPQAVTYHRHRNNQLRALLQALIDTLDPA
jgi:hypothetical protein